MAKINVQQSEVTILTHQEQDYISLTDMANAKESESRAADIIKNWLRNRYTLEFIGTWEMIHNPHFKVVEFDHFKSQAGLPTFGLSPGLWKERTNAVGFIVIQGKGGTYAHKDIAFEFCSAINPIFKLFLIKEFQRLKVAETNHQTLEWSVQRMISKINYHIHTNAIKENLIPNALTKEQATIIYANEADLLNVALFGMTSKQWHHSNPNFEGNIRDQATLEQLVVLSNMESINALLIQQGLNSQERIMQLNQVAITQMKSLITAKGLKRLNANQ